MLPALVNSATKFVKGTKFGLTKSNVNPRVSLTEIERVAAN